MSAGKGIVQEELERAMNEARAEAMHQADVWPIDGPTWEAAFEAGYKAGLRRAFDETRET